MYNEIEISGVPTYSALEFIVSKINETKYYNIFEKIDEIPSLIFAHRKK